MSKLVVANRVVVMAAPTIKPASKPSFVMPPNRELALKYGDIGSKQTDYLAIRGISNIYEMLAQQYAVMSSIFSSNTIAEAAGPRALVDTSMYPSTDYKKKTAPLFADDLNAKFMKVTRNYIETRIKMLPINFWLELNPTDTGPLESAVKLIRAYLPNFSVPTKTESLTDEDGVTYEAMNIDDQPVLYTASELANKEPGYIQNPRWTAKDGMKYPKVTKKYVDTITLICGPEKEPGIANIEFKINRRRSEVNSINNSYFKAKGDLTHGPLIGHFEVDVDLVLRWPTEFAYWVTCASSPETFYPALFMNYLNVHRMAYVQRAGDKQRGVVKIPARVNHLGHIKAMNKILAKTEGARKILVNEDHFLILGPAEPARTGSVMWVPPNEDRVDDYLQQLREAYYPETNTVNNSVSSRLRGTAVLTDAANSKFTYANDSGNLTTINLVGSVPLDDVTIKKWLDAKVNEYTETDQYWKTFFSELQKVVSQLNPDLITDYITNNSTLSALTYTNLATMYERLCSSALDITCANIGGKPLDEPDKEKYKFERAVLPLVHKCAEYALANFDQLEIAYSSKIFHFRFQLMLICKYAGNYSDYQKYYNNVIKSHKAEGVDLNDTNIKVVNLPGLKELMPHQVRQLNVVSTDPSGHLLDAGVGAGKTILLIINAMRLKQEGKINRGLIVVPNKLVRSWVSEIQTHSNGEINPFPITAETTRLMNRVLNPGTYKQNPELPFDQLKKLIEKQPPNTLFITSTSFLSRGRNVQAILYGNKIVRRFKLADFIKDLGFDFVGIDESQDVKNLTSSATVATSIVTSNAKSKRLASGTIISNVPADLVGQMAMINPAALGRQEEFRNKYTMDPTAASSPLRPGAEIEVSREIQKYASKFIAKKREWAFLLPPLSKQVYLATMTPKQQKYYDSIVDDILKKLLEDPKVQELLAKDTKSSEAKLRAILESNFQKAELFVSAPDQYPLYVSQLKAEGNYDVEDLISPKVGKLIEILDDHFNVKKSPFKVLVFCYRKDTPEHIYRYLPEKYKKMASVYTVARGMKAMENFTNNPAKKILIASESSINRGFNQQFADTLVRMETLWAPGPQEQALGRIFRPDTKNKYNRPTIYLDYVITNKSIDVAKFARMASKEISKMMMDESDNPEFRHVPYGPAKVPLANQLAQLPLVKMTFNPKSPINIQKFSEWENVKSYYNTLALMNKWEEEQFAKIRALNLKMIPIDNKNRARIPGSVNLAKANGWIPRVAGSEPFNWQGYDLSPVAIQQSLLNSTGEEEDNDDDDEDADSETVGNEKEEEDLVTINAVEIDQLVDTEFGPGYVKRIKKNELDVYVPGMNPPVVTVSKSTCYVFLNPDEEKLVVSQLKKAGKNGLARRPGVVPSDTDVVKINVPVAPKKPDNDVSPRLNLNPKKPASKRVDEDIDESVFDPDLDEVPSDDDDVDISDLEDIDADDVAVDADDIDDDVPAPAKPTKQPPKLTVKISEPIDTEEPEGDAYVFVEIINGTPVLSVEAKLVNVDAFLDEGWKLYPKHIATRIITPDGIDLLFAAIEKQGFVIPESDKNLFYPYKRPLQNRVLHKINATHYSSTVHFLNVRFSPIKNKNTLRLFPMVSSAPNLPYPWALLAASSLDQQPLGAKLVGKQLVPATKAKAFVKDGPFLMRACRTKVEALNILKQTETDLIDVKDYQGTLQEIRDLKI